MRVFVYRNLHRNTWSVKALTGPQRGRVIAHSDHVLVTNAEGKVSQAGRERVLRERRKNVHAGIVGTLASLEPQDFTGSKPVTYNPYRYDRFVYKTDEAPFDGAPEVYLSDRGVLAAVT